MICRISTTSNRVDAKCEVLNAKRLGFCVGDGAGGIARLFQNSAADPDELGGFLSERLPLRFGRAFRWLQ